MKYTLLLILISPFLVQCAQGKRQSAQQEENIRKTVTTGDKQHVDTKSSEIKLASFSTDDSTKVVKRINDAVAFYNKTKGGSSDAQANEQQLIMHIARGFIGTPYVAKTLERNEKEKLVVNQSELDCTTFVENVLAIYLCAKRGEKSFEEYLKNLRNIRYVDGTVSYTTRQHYFTEWIEENTKDGIVKEIQTPNPPFSGMQKIQINFMSTHQQLYPMMNGNEDVVKDIADMEKRLSGKTYKYIPKENIRNNNLFRNTIHDGDIIAITTSKKGLDTSHIGIAVWHSDGLHLLNASQIHKKVVEEPMTLYQYMQKHPSQTGIRIVRITP